MKRTVLSLITAALCVAAQGQTWCPPGATWHYRILNNNMGMITDGTIKIARTGTATVKNTVCSQLDITFHGAKYIQNTTPTVNTTSGGSYYTYLSAGVAYLYNSNLDAFDTIVNFNASIGDKWSFAQGTGTNCMLPRYWLQVYDTGHVTINGFSLKSISASDVWSNGVPTHTFVERISQTTGYLFMRQWCHTDEMGDGNFSCYSDATFPLLHNQEVPMCDFNTVSIAEHARSSEFACFPNPASDRIIITTETPGSASILDASGRMVYDAGIQAGKNEIITRTLTPGIYMLHVSGAHMNAAQKVVIAD
jgi:hypothetical protein